MTTFLSPPPTATYLAFHPQDNNIVAIGMDDSTIFIYNVRLDEVCFTCLFLEGLINVFIYKRELREMFIYILFLRKGHDQA